MENDLTNPIISVYASMKIFRSQAVPGTLTLLRDRIQFQAAGVIKGSEIKDTFLFSDIKNIKSGISFSPFRIVITEKSEENWIFDQVPRQDAKKFVDLFNTIK